MVNETCAQSKFSELMKAGDRGNGPELRLQLVLQCGNMWLQRRLHSLFFFFGYF